MGTSARMQSSGFIPLNFQRVMQSFTYVTLKSQRSRADKLKHGGIRVQRT